MADERDGWAERSVREQENISETSWSRCEALEESWKGMSGKVFEPTEIEPLRPKKKG